MTKTELIAFIAACADASGDLDIKRAIGSGSDFELRNETVSAGVGFTVPGVLDCILEGITSAINQTTQSTLFDDFHTLNVTNVEDLVGGVIAYPIQTTWVYERSTATEHGQGKVALMPAQLFPADEAGAGLLVLETVGYTCWIRFMDGAPTINGSDTFILEARFRTPENLSNNEFDIGLLGVDGSCLIRNDNGVYTFRCSSTGGTDFETISLSTNTWYTIKMEKRSNNFIYCYLNDVFEGTLGSGGSAPNSSSGLGRYVYLEDTRGAGSENYSLLIDYISIQYNRLTGTTSGDADHWVNPHTQY
jgi:hypothetical protein